MIRPTKENALNPHPSERRVALEKRRLVSEMSVEEMRRELLTSQVTGLPNRRAFDEAGPAPAVAMADMDGLKCVAYVVSVVVQRLQPIHVGHGRGSAPGRSRSIS